LELAEIVSFSDLNTNRDFRRAVSAHSRVSQFVLSIRAFSSGNNQFFNFFIKGISSDSTSTNRDFKFSINSSFE